ncbi:hypothetical protein D3C87_1446890 [compost metagenome]
MNIYGSLVKLRSRLVPQNLEFNDTISMLSNLVMKGEALHDYAQKNHVGKPAFHI